MAPATIVEAEPIEAPDKEAEVKRNPHADFAAVEAARPAYDHGDEWKMTKAPRPEWKAGQGATSDHWKGQKYCTIDPQGEDRTVPMNYKLFISCTVPRPIALISTLTADGQTRNIAPFSYWQCVTSDPPLYSVSFSGRQQNDTLKNILETKEACISLTTDWIIEAANFTSVNTPRTISEWELSGLTPKMGEVVKPPFVAESPYSVECKLHSFQHLYSARDPSVYTATLVLLQVQRFHIWEDVLTADGTMADMAKLRPVFRAGAITYGTCFDGFEIPRPVAFRLLREDPEIEGIVQEAKAAKQGVAVPPPAPESQETPSNGAPAEFEKFTAADKL